MIKSEKINQLQIRLLSNELYNTYRSYKIETVKAMVQSNPEAVSQLLANHPELKDQIDSKGYEKIQYWLKK